VVFSTKLSLESLVLAEDELLVSDSVYGAVLLFLCHIGMMLTLLSTLGISLNLSNSSFMELLMIGIDLVRNSAKTSIYGT